MTSAAARRIPHRDRMLRAGNQLFYRHGYHGTSVDAILAEAHAPKGSFYHHFGSKESFGFAVLQQYGDGRLGFLNRWLERSDLDVVDRIIGYHAELVERFRRTGWEKACLAGKLSNEVAWSSPPFREQLSSVFTESRDVLRNALAKGQERDEVRADAPAEALADAVQAIIQGGFIAALALRDGNSLTQITAAIADLLRPERLGDSPHNKWSTATATSAAGRDAALPTVRASTPPHRADAPPKRSHREALLREGLRQIFMNGCHGTTVDGLLAASGVPKGSFYHHFGTKDAFVSAVLERYGAFHLERLANWQGQDDLTTAQQLSGYFADLVAIFLRSDHLYSDLSGKIVCELAVASDPLREQVADNLRSFLDALELMLAAGQRRGDVTADREPEALTAAIHALIDGAFLVVQSTRDDNTLDSVAAAIGSLVQCRTGDRSGR